MDRSVSQSAHASPPGARAHILVLDDAGDVRDLLREVLEDAGYRVTLAGEALEPRQIAALRPDVLILDLLFSGENLGRELLRRIHDHPATAGLPVVVCSASPEAIDRLRAEGGLERTLFLLKPFDLTALEAIVAEALGDPGLSAG